MVNEVLVSDISGGLRNPLFYSGKLLLELLDKKEQDLPITAAFWLLDSENRTWKYILASPTVDTKGPLNAYKILQRYIEDVRRLELGYTLRHTEDARLEPALTLQDITVVSPDEPVVNLLRTAMKTLSISIFPIHFAGNWINNVFIDDAYIYRMAPNSPRDHSTE